jgi:hypothetical protein
MPEIQINYLVVIVAVIVSVVFGFIWFTIIFGRTWAKEINDPGTVRKKRRVNNFNYIFFIWAKPGSQPNSTNFINYFKQDMVIRAVQKTGP